MMPSLFDSWTFKMLTYAVPLYNAVIALVGVRLLLPPYSSKKWRLFSVLFLIGVALTWGIGRWFSRRLSSINENTILILEAFPSPQVPQEKSEEFKRLLEKESTFRMTDVYDMHFRRSAFQAKLLMPLLALGYASSDSYQMTLGEMERWGKLAKEKNLEVVEEEIRITIQAMKTKPDRDLSPKAKK